MNRPTKAVIVAAGEGKRCRPHTHELPKSLLPLNGKTILEHQLDALSANGVTSVSLIRGYKASEFKQSGIRYYENVNYEHNNVLLSLMIAERELDGDCLISYGDIVYTMSVVNAVAESPGDIAVVVDTSWRQRYVDRFAHPVTEAEKVIADKRRMVIQIGKHIVDSEAVLGEFIGLMKLTGTGCQLFRERFREAKAQYDGRPFQRANSFHQAYLTDMLQEMIERGIPVHAVSVEGGWVEIDTAEDYEYAERVFKGALP